MRTSQALNAALHNPEWEERREAALELAVPDDRYVSRPPTVPSHVIEPKPINAFRGGGLPQGWRIIGIGGRAYVRRPATSSDRPDRRVIWADTEREAIERMRRKYERMAFSHRAFERHIKQGGSIEDY